MNMQVSELPISDTELISKLEELKDEYGGIYIEFGGLRNYKTVGRDQEGWYYHDHDHPDQEFRVPSLRLAMECLINPPNAEEWLDNIQEQSSLNPEDQ